MSNIMSYYVDKHTKLKPICTELQHIAIQIR